MYDRHIYIYIQSSAVTMWSDLSGYYIHRAYFRFAPSQWEMALLCNDVSHWLSKPWISSAYNTAITVAESESQKVNRILESKQNILPAQASYGVSIVRILERIDRVIMAPHNIYTYIYIYITGFISLLSCTEQWSTLPKNEIMLHFFYLIKWSSYLPVMKLG